MKQAVIDGLGTLEFPDDTPDEVIDKTVKREIRTRAIEADNEKTRQMAVDDTGSPFLVAVGRGMMDVVQGVKQLGLKAGEGLGLIDKPAPTMSGLITGQQPESRSQEYTRRVENELELYNRLSDKHPIQSFAGRLTGNVAAAPVPGGVGANALTRIATAGAGSGLAAGAMFTPEGESRLRNMAIGTLSGAGMQGVIGEPLRALGRGAASTAGEAAERAEIVEAGKRLKVPVFHPDVTNNPLAKESAILAERGGPLGTAGGRLRQEEAAKEAAQRTLASMKGNYQLGDISDEIRTSLGDRFARFQKVKTLKYARAAKVADTAGSIPTPKFTQTLSQVIQDAQSGGIPNPALIQKLENIGQAPKGNFSITNALDDDLGDEISKFYSGGENAAVGKKGVQYFQQLKTSLRADVETHLATNKPDAIPLMKNADKFYQDSILPFKRTQLGKIISDKADFNPEQAWKFVERNADNPTMMRALYSSLSPKGRVAVKAGLMKEAFDAGMVPPREGGAKVFSPGRAAGYLEEKLALADQFLKPDEALEFRGMVKLFRAIQRAGQVAENPPTGARLLLPGLIVSAFWSAKAAALVGGGLLTAKTLFSTEFSRKALVKLAELPLDHPQTMSLVNEISAALRNRIPGPLVQPTIQEEE